MAKRPKNSVVPFYVSGVSASNSTPSIKRVFENRKKYNKDVFPEDLIPNVAYTWGKDRFYGKINTRGNSIVPGGIFMKSLKYTNQQQNYYAMNFVADAWRDFAEKLRSLAANNTIYQQSVWAAPVIEKAYVTPSIIYDNYMKDTVFDIFTNSFLGQTSRSKKTVDFDTFLDQMGDFLNNVIRNEGILTRSGIIESFYTPPFMTGLIIEVSSGDYSNDKEKSQKFGDLNFGLVAEIASQYGFSIDRNIPWRLVADISSKAMQEYMVGVPIVGVEGNFANRLDECREIVRRNPGDLPDFYGYSEIPGFENVKRHIAAYIDEGDEGEELKPGYFIYQNIRTAPDQKTVAQIIFDNAYEETYFTDMAFLTPYLATFYDSYVSSSPLFSEYISMDEYDPLISACKSKTRVVRRLPLPFNQQVIGTPTSRYNFKWSYKTFYQVRMAERNKIEDPAATLKNLRSATNQYDFSSGTSLQKYFTTIEYIQQNYVGPFQTKFLNIDRVGDLLEEQGQSSGLDNSEEGSYDAVSDARQQEPVRRGIY